MDIHEINIRQLIDLFIAVILIPKNNHKPYRIKNEEKEGKRPTVGKTGRQTDRQTRINSRTDISKITNK